MATKVCRNGIRKNQFMDLMNYIYIPYLDTFVILFIDDILIYSQSEDKHSQYLQSILELLRKRNCTENFLSVSSGYNQYFLAYVVSKDRIYVDPSQIKAIKN